MIDWDKASQCHSHPQLNVCLRINNKKKNKNGVFVLCEAPVLPITALTIANEASLLISPADESMKLSRSLHQGPTGRLWVRNFDSEPSTTTVKRYTPAKTLNSSLETILSLPACIHRRLLHSE